jgi:rhodanese-related sulfurtransferase
VERESLVPAGSQAALGEFVRIGLLAVGLLTLKLLAVGPTREPLRVLVRHNLPLTPTTFLDVSSMDEYRVGHLQGARSMHERVLPLGELADRKRHPTLVVYDSPGRLTRATNVALKLHQLRGDTILVLADPDVARK